MHYSSVTKKSLFSVAVCALLAAAPAKATVGGDGYGKNERGPQQSASTPAVPVARLLDQRISMWALPGQSD